MARPSIGAHASGADGSGAERRGVRQAAAASSRSCWAPRVTYGVGSGVAARATAGTAKPSSPTSAPQARSLRATLHRSTPQAPGPLRLEEELRFVVVDQQANLFGEHVVVAQRRVGVDDVERNL